jgi:hypothetical protein
MNVLKRLLREPLLHFAVIGMILFGISMVWKKSEPSPSVIALSKGDVENLASLFERTWRRPPTAQELNGLIAGRVREEVLFREAQALSLDDNDPIIRRRLVQKVDFLTDDLAARRDPTDAELQAYLDQNAKDYEIEPRLSFKQVFFNTERRGEALKDEAADTLSQIKSGVAPDTLGDPTLLPQTIDNEPPSVIARQFGRAFTDRVAHAEPMAWFGPVPSAYGSHLVLVTAKKPARKPALSDVRKSVERDWRAAQRRAARDAFYSRLRQKYRVTVVGKSYGDEATDDTRPAGNKPDAAE